MYESQELNYLFEALAKAQGSMENAKKDSEQSHLKSKYADLTSVVNCSRPALSANGLSVTQRTIPKEGKTYMATRLCHISGQWIESLMEINPGKPDIQSLGSYLTYLRRYAYAALVGVVTTDDDGEGDMQITGKEVDIIYGLLQGMDDYKDTLLKGYKIKDISDFRNGRIEDVITHLKLVRTKRGL